MQTKPKLWGVLLLYVAALYGIWAFMELGIVPRMELQMSEAWIEIIKEIVCKILIWCIPAWLLVRCFDDGMKIKSGEFFSCKKGIVPFFLLMLLFTAYQLATSYWKHGQIALNPSMEMCYLVSSVTIGLSEEMVFRGWLLNATLKDKGQWIAVGINALLFLAIHFPFWIRSGLFTAYFTTGSFIQVLVLSCLFSWMFIKSRSILLPAILHAYWDLLCYIV